MSTSYIQLTLATVQSTKADNPTEWFWIDLILSRTSITNTSIKWKKIRVFWPHVATFMVNSPASRKEVELGEVLLGDFSVSSWHFKSSFSENSDLIVILFDDNLRKRNHHISRNLSVWTYISLFYQSLTHGVTNMTDYSEIRIFSYILR